WAAILLGRERPVHQSEFRSAEIGRAELGKMSAIQTRLTVERCERRVRFGKRRQSRDAGEALARDTRASFRVGRLKRAFECGDQWPYVEGLRGGAGQRGDRFHRCFRLTAGG